MTTMKMDNDESFEMLVQQIELAGGIVKGRDVRCPWHDDNSSSGSIYEGNDGRFRYRCHTTECAVSGDWIDLKALNEGTNASEVLKSMGAKDEVQCYELLEDIPLYGFTLEDTYYYGNSGLVILRLRGPDGKKKFKQLTHTKRGYILKAPPKPWPIYNAEEIASKSKIVLVEGEKCVKALGSINIPATTSSGGAEGGASIDWSPLRGKTVCIWPDNDKPGVKYGNNVKNILISLGCRVVWLDPSTLMLSEKGDAADFIDIDPGSARARVLAALATARPVGGASGLLQQLKDTAAGKRRVVNFLGWNKLSDMSQALAPQTLSMFCGPPGSRKSLMMLNAFIKWTQAGIKCSMCHLEEDKDYHLRRCLAIMSGNNEVLKNDWVEDHGQESIDLFTEYQDHLNDLSEGFYVPDTEDMSYSVITKWIESEAKAGSRVIIIDPVTSIDEEGKNVWTADKQFINFCIHLLREYNTSIILITHPKQMFNAPDMSQLAGGAAFTRHTQTVIWVESHTEKHEPMWGATADGALGFNTTLHLLKTRNGEGNGHRLAYNFDKDTLRFSEQGAINGKG